MRYILLAFFGLYLFSINIVIAGDINAGKERYAVNCGNCHGPGGMGLASYPRISGKETPYLIDRLKTTATRQLDAAIPRVASRLGQFFR